MYASDSHVSDPHVSDHDTLPYLSLPIAYTQPSHLAAFAHLAGLKAPAMAEARVLELGCASGGNILPLAARWPRARFVGVDLAPRHIADGHTRIAALGLKNVTLECRDIADLTLPAKGFDYVICHGVFSWIARDVQEAMLRVISHCLVDYGVAAISYNVLPGWHLRSPVRDILLSRTAAQWAPRDRVAQARETLRQIETSVGSGPYASLLRDEARRLARMPSSYILGEFLAAHNAPISFPDFARQAADHGLAYLCEADLDAGALADVSVAARRRLGELAATDRLQAAEQIDLFSGRPFRRSLLVKQSAIGGASAPRADRLVGLHMACRLTPDAVRNKAGLLAFLDRRGEGVATRTAPIGQAFARLGEAYPATVPVAALIGGGAHRTRIAGALLSIVTTGRAALWTTPVAVGHASDARPKAWPFARAEAAMGLPYVTSLHHIAVSLPKIAAAVTTRLDGTNDRAALVAWLTDEIASGGVPLPDGEPAATVGTDRAPAAALAEGHVAETLRHLAASAVLQDAAG